jgi:hypothetical protein
MLLCNCSLATVHQMYLHALHKLNRITDTTSMGKSNDTNLKPLLPILFFNKHMKIWMVLVLHQDSWRNRLCGTSTTMGVKVLTLLSHTILHFPPHKPPLIASMCIFPWLHQLRPGRLQCPQPMTTALETCPLSNTTYTQLGISHADSRTELGVPVPYFTSVLASSLPATCVLYLYQLYQVTFHKYNSTAENSRCIQSQSG